MSARCPGCKAVVVIPFPPTDHQSGDLLDAVPASSAITKSLKPNVVSDSVADVPEKPSSEIEPPRENKPSKSKPPENKRLAETELKAESKPSSERKPNAKPKSPEPSAGSNKAKDDRKNTQDKSTASLASAEPIGSQLVAGESKAKPKQTKKRRRKRKKKSLSDSPPVAKVEPQKTSTQKTEKDSTPSSPRSSVSTSPGPGPKHPSKKEETRTPEVDSKKLEQPRASELDASEKIAAEDHTTAEHKVPVRPLETASSKGRAKTEKKKARERVNSVPKPEKPKEFTPPSSPVPKVEREPSIVVSSPAPDADQNQPIEIVQPSNSTKRKPLVDLVPKRESEKLPKVEDSFPMFPKAAAVENDTADVSAFQFESKDVASVELSSQNRSAEQGLSSLEVRTRRANADRVTLTRFFAAMLVFVGIVNFAPAIYCWYTWSQEDIDFLLPRWIYLQIFIAVLHLVYAVLLLQVPDWSTLRSIAIVMLAFAFVFGLFSMGLLTTGGNGLLAQFLQVPDSLGRQACIWCVAMLCLATLASYLAGRESNTWQRTEKLLAEILANKESV